MQKRLLITAAAMFLFVMPVAAQVAPNCGGTEPLTAEEQKRCIEMAERTTALVSGTRFYKPHLDLLPGSNNAWIVHLITTGGFTGRGLPTITVRSTGEYACGEDDSVEFSKLSGEKLEVLSELMITSNLTVEKGQKKAEDQPGGYMCNDCLVTSLSMARRDASGKTKTYLSFSDLAKYARIAEQFDSIKKAVENLGVCR